MDLSKEQIAAEAKKYRTAQTVFRDKDGKITEKIDSLKIGIIVDKEELIAQSEEAKKKKIQKLNEERINEWGVGFKDLEDIKKQTFANYQVSREVEREMLEKDRFGDPMERLMKKTKIEQQEMSKHEKFYLGKKCKFSSYPNRFGIEPGYRWDGCDRGNGYEQKYFQNQNQRKAKEIDSYQQHQKEM